MSSIPDLLLAAAIRNTIQKYKLKFKSKTALVGLPADKKWDL